MEASGPSRLVVEGVVVVELEVVQTNWIVDVAQSPSNLKAKKVTCSLPDLEASKIIKTYSTS